MLMQMTTKVVLDPVQEKETLEKYENDAGWTKVSETDVSVVFVTDSPQFPMEATYLPGKKAGLRD